MRWLLPTAALAVALLLASAGAAPRARGGVGPAVPPAPARPSAAPLGPKAVVGWTHAPYAQGDCAVCHERKDPKNPGKLVLPVNALCFSCHEELRDLMDQRPRKHEPAEKSCTQCHNPHDAPAKMLLHQELGPLCFGCHPDTAKETVDAGVPHLPVTRGDQCMNCHNPHASSSERLLRFPALTLCLGCHGRDDVRDTRGVRLANIEATIDAGRVLHGPVGGGDCTSCHRPHGSNHFRLLTDPYPRDFYAPYDEASYALCFSCHKADMVRDAETTTLTRFRNGSRNLHHVHVNHPQRGRTCRACHETHASRQPHLIRDTVPYGPNAWPLDVNFTPLPEGGECARTCHASRRYSRSTPVKYPPRTEADR